MTDCTTQPLLFSSLGSKKIQADFNGGSLTSDAGALLLREVDKRLGLIDALDRCIPDPRNEFYLVHLQKTLLAQRIFGMALGYEDLNDHQTLREDPVHGNQEKRFFHGYYDRYCFLPLYVFCGSQLLVAYLRPSNIDAAHHSRAILKLLVQRFRQVWPGVRIIFRGDSGFCRWRLMRWCDRHEVNYIIGLARNAVLERLAQPWRDSSRTRFEQSGQKQRIFGELTYAAETWDRPRRVIVKAEHLPQGENTRFVVTNLAGDPQELYDKLYCQRGAMENRIKEQQLGLFADRTSCHDFVANQFRVLLSAAAYVLMETIRRVGLAQTELAHAQVGTIRRKLLKIGARVVCSVRRIVLHLAGGYPYRAIFAEVLCRLGSAFLPRLTSG